MTTPRSWPGREGDRQSCSDRHPAHPQLPGHLRALSCPRHPRDKAGLSLPPSPPPPPPPTPLTPKPQDSGPCCLTHHTHCMKVESAAPHTQPHDCPCRSNFHCYYLGTCLLPIQTPQLQGLTSRSLQFPSLHARRCYQRRTHI